MDWLKLLVYVGLILPVLAQEETPAGLLMPVPLVEDGSRVSTGMPDEAWRLEAARGALEAGLSGLAVNLYEEIVTERGGVEALEAKDAEGLIKGLLASGRLPRAGEVLNLVDERGSPSIPLWKSWIEFLGGRTGDAVVLLRRIEVDGLREGDRAWYYLLEALVAQRGRNFDRMNASFDSAMNASGSAWEQAHFELMRLRSEILLGNRREEDLPRLRERAREFEGQRIGFEASRQIAILLNAQGAKEESIRLIEGQLRLPGVLASEWKNEFLLLLSLISGDESGRGRLALRQLLTSDAGIEIQREALALLSRAPFDGQYQAEFLAFLGEVIGRAEPSPILDEFLIVRASLLSRLQQYDQAEADAKRMIEVFPGSGFRKSGLRLLGDINWERKPKRLRTAASYLSQLRGITEAPEERSRLAVFIGDCYFQNGDYLNASEAYGSALSGGWAGEGGSIVFQRVLSEIRGGRLEEAERVLNETGAVVPLASDYRWKAEWNLIQAMRDNDQEDAAFRRLRRLLGDAEEGKFKPELEMKIRWMEARLALDTGRAVEVPDLVDGLLGRLELWGTAGVASESIRTVASHSLLMKGEALIKMGQQVAAKEVFAELRRDYEGSGADILSYLVEARAASANNSIVEAQKSLIELADQFSGSRYAPIAQWEAALELEKRGLDSSYREGIGLLDGLLTRYPNHPLAYYARLKQADLSRRLNEFGTALVLYEELINLYPSHPERYRAELSRGDCLLARGSLREDSLVAASVAFERLASDRDVPMDARLEAGCKWGISLEQRGLNVEARNAFFLVYDRLFKEEGALDRLGVRGRYWLARLMLKLGSGLEKENSIDEAIRIYRIMIDRGLPGEANAKARLQQLTKPKE